VQLQEKYAGVSVTHNNIEASVRPTGERWTVPVDDTGIADIAGHLNGVHPAVVVLAANGRRELPVAGRLVAEGLRCAFVPPLQVRDFARTIGRVSHLVHKEAEILAHFAELVRPVERSLSPDHVTHLRAIERRRKEIRDMIELERDRWQGAIPIVRRDLRAHIQFLERNLQAIEEEFNSTVRSSPIWR
jgi:transposase